MSKVKFLTNISLERFLIFTLGLSLFLSNTGIYAASFSLALYFVWKILSNQEYREFILGEKIAIVSLALYFLGLFVTCVYPGHTEDILWYARKAAFLLILPPLLYAFRDKKTRIVALTSLFTGFWLAVLYTGNQAGWQWGGGRLAGTWLIDIWSVLMALFLVFMVPLIFRINLGKLRLLYMLTTLAAFLLLIMSGGRGPWLGALVAVSFFLIVRQPKWFFLTVVVITLTYFPIQDFMETKLEGTIKRAESITDLNDHGNWIRLNLWELSLRHSIYTAQNEPAKFLLGHGPINHINSLLPFYDRTDFLTPEERKRFHPYPTNDIHNMFLDSLAKMGIIWTFLTMFFIAWIPFHGYLKLKNASQNYFIFSCGCGVIAFMTIGVFYSIMLHWATYMLFFFATLSYSASKYELCCQLPGNNKQ